MQLPSSETTQSQNYKIISFGVAYTHWGDIKIYCGTIGGELLEIDYNTFSIDDVFILSERSSINVVQYSAKLETLVCLDNELNVHLYNIISKEHHVLYSSDLEETPHRLDGIYKNASQGLTLHPNQEELIVRTRSGNLVMIDIVTRTIQSRLFVEIKDIITIRCISSKDFLIGTGTGEVVYIKDERPHVTWKTGSLDVHWIEPHNGHYYAVGDEALVCRIDLNTLGAFCGPVFARDDLEHITTYKDQLVATGFDGNLYVINKHTCEPERSIFQFEYKNRWIKHIDDDVFVVQSQNGSLYKFSEKNGIVAKIKKTPDALWCLSRSNDQFIYACGEGPYLSCYEPALINSATYKLRARLSIPTQLECYAKRMITLQDESVVIGMSSGEVIRFTKKEADYDFQTITKVPSLIWDIKASVRQLIYLATMDGVVYEIDHTKAKRQKIWTSEHGKPIFALAVSPNGKYLCCSENLKFLYIIDIESSEVLSKVGHEYSKDIMWIDNSTILYTDAQTLSQLKITEKFDVYEREVILGPRGNTIEKFEYIPELGLIFGVNYLMEVFVADHNQKEYLIVSPDQADFSKGIMITAKSIDKVHFITVGRENVLRHYCYNIEDQTLYTELGLCL